MSIIRGDDLPMAGDSGHRRDGAGGYRGRLARIGMDLLVFVLDVPELLSRNAVRLILLVICGLALVAAAGMSWQILGSVGGE